jgi:hypothetical protein
MLGGPTYTFLEHLSTKKLIDDLLLLYIRLVDLGIEHHNGQAYLADIDELCGNKKRSKLHSHSLDQKEGR